MTPGDILIYGLIAAVLGFIWQVAKRLMAGAIGSNEEAAPPTVADNRASGDASDAPRAGTTALGVVAFLLGLLFVATAIYNATGTLVNVTSTGRSWMAGVPRWALMPDAILHIVGSACWLSMACAILKRSRLALWATGFGLATTSLRTLLNCLIVVPLRANSRPDTSAAMIGGLLGLLLTWALSAMVYLWILSYLRSARSQREFTEHHRNANAGCHGQA